MPSFLKPADWSNCADDLTGLRRAARDATDDASEVAGDIIKWELIYLIALCTIDLYWHIRI